MAISEGFEAWLTDLREVATEKQLGYDADPLKLFKSFENGDSPEEYVTQTEDPARKRLKKRFALKIASGSLRGYLFGLILAFCTTVFTREILVDRDLTKIIHNLGLVLDDQDAIKKAKTKDNRRLAYEAARKHSDALVYGLAYHFGELVVLGQVTLFTYYGAFLGILMRWRVQNFASRQKLYNRFPKLRPRKMY